MISNTGKPAILSISISEQVGQKKHNVERAWLIKTGGIEDDAHSHSGRPVSLLPIESFPQSNPAGLELSPGIFAENITTVSLDFQKLQVGTHLRLGDGVELEVTQIGKECHDLCEIGKSIGDCIMPREGVFAKVISGGELKPGDPIEILAGK